MIRSNKRTYNLCPVHLAPVDPIKGCDQCMTTLRQEQWDGLTLEEKDFALAAVGILREYELG